VLPSITTPDQSCARNNLRACSNRTKLTEYPLIPKEPVIRTGPDFSIGAAGGFSN
jgi:hypothetical protein